MAGIDSLLNIGKSALLIQQKAIDITGNNIANVNTPGYSRQRLVIQQNHPIRVADATLSTGVTADQGIQRLYDQFLGAQLNGENEQLGRWEARKSALDKAELMFDEAAGLGLSNAMNEYWNSWQALSNNPQGIAERSSLLSAGQHLASTFNQIYNNIGKLQEDIDAHVDQIVDEVNQMASQIADLNNKITQVESGGHNANDYRDERDQLVFNLSKLVDINSFEDGNGSVSVMVGNGRPLVESGRSWSLTTVDNGGVQDIHWQNPNGTTADITTQLTGGELKGWTEARDVLLPNYLSQLDTLANNLMTEVNNLHASGATLDPVTTTGVDFFTGSNAGNIAVNTAIESNLDLIAAANTTTDGLPGGNSIALAIANLQSAGTMPGGSNFSDYYNSLVGRVGSDVQAADFSQNHQETMVRSLKNYRQEVAGVSLDEEMVNLVQFQHAYNAAAKVITTADEMLDSLISMVR